MAAAFDTQEVLIYFAVSLAQILLIALVMRPLEARYPCETWPDRRLTRIDRTYTLLKLLLVIPIVSFVVMPWFGTLLGDGPDGVAPLQLDHLLPVLAGHPLATFLLYFVIYDFVFYVIHRLQHVLPWWWGLHSLHHSQRHLNCWSNDRDHYLDDLFELLILSGVSAVLGAAPIEYALLVLLGKLIEEFSHANVRIGYGKVFNKLLVDPPFHRLHHMVADYERPHLHNSNFSLVFPIWDILFGTALYNEPPRPCGVNDADIDADNERGLVAQQIAGLRRFVRGLKPGAVRP